jgi:hypothetical protein
VYPLETEFGREHQRYIFMWLCGDTMSEIAPVTATSRSSNPDSELVRGR